MLSIERPLAAQRCLCLLLCISAIGCDSDPKAPALRDSPVYQNNQEGLRFLVPDNWLQSASAALPSTDLEGEVVLVQYKMRTAGKSAAFEVLCFNEKTIDDLADYHASGSHAVANWTPAEDPETVEINGQSGEHFVFTARVGGEEMMKDVVSFRRDKRIYSFIGLVWVADKKAQEQLKRTFDSIMWR